MRSFDSEEIEVDFWPLQVLYALAGINFEREDFSDLLGALGGSRGKHTGEN